MNKVKSKRTQMNATKIRFKLEQKKEKMLF